MKVVWVSRIRENKYDSINRPKIVEVYDHPLKPIPAITVVDRTRRRKISSASSTGTSTPLIPETCTLDPLSQFVKEEELDPLSQILEEEKKKEDFTDSLYEKKLQDGIVPWSHRRSSILLKFTTSKKLSIVTSFLQEGEKVIPKPLSSTADKIKYCLEQLDDFDESSVRHMLDLSQQEYVSRINQLRQELVQAWEENQRVKSLKIAIQCSKLLVDVSVVQFYPSKFVLITDILDTFGKLVYNRLLKKAQQRNPLPTNFTPDMVHETAKELCRNWFYKISSIRELVPRLYVEMAILRSYSFLSSADIPTAVALLTKAIRGIGDPLVALYLRCYLCRVAIEVTPADSKRSYLMDNFEEFLLVYNQISSPSVKAELAKQNVDMSSYLTLYTPGLDYIVQALATSAPQKLLMDILARCQEKNTNGLVLNALLNSLEPRQVSSQALELVGVLTRDSPDEFPRHALLRTLGLCLASSAPGREHHRTILAEVWREVAALPDPANYASCAEVWVDFVVQHFTARELNNFLGDVINHMLPNKAYESHYAELKNIMNTILQGTQDFETLLSIEKFLPFIDLFQQETVHVEVSKTLLEAFCAVQNQMVSDPVVINSLMYICRSLHDSVNALTVDDEKRQIANLISGFVRSVDHGRDFEQQLEFYVEARGAFANLDPVAMQLVYSVNKLAIDVKRLVKGHLSRKTAAFIKACVAFCYITIPSIESEITRLELYLLSGQVALLNSCLGQADSFFKASIAVMTELPQMAKTASCQKNLDHFLVSYIRRFLSTLLIVPDNPEYGQFFFLKSLLNVLQSHPWEQTSLTKSTIYLNFLDVLIASMAETYPYHVDGVESNDTLYGSNPKFIAEANQICGYVLEELLTDLKMLRKSDQLPEAFRLALKICVSVSLYADLSQEHLSTLVVNLWHICQSSRENEHLVKAMVEFVKSRQ